MSEQQLEALFGRALHPVTGARLGRAWRPDAVTGFDLCFSAPKSVSGLWALADPDLAGQVRAAHAAAVRAGIGALEQLAAFSRVGTNGHTQVRTAGLTGAVFEHRTSRAGDPQLHSHVLVVNKVRCPDGRWRTLDGTELYRHKKAAGAIYQAALRAELSTRLGVEWDEVNQHGQAEVAGIPDRLLTVWSKRTAAVEAEAAPVVARFEGALGRDLTAAERVGITKTAVLATRPVKVAAPPEVLTDRWRAEAARLGITADALVPRVAGRAGARRRGPAPVGLLGDAVGAAGRRRAVFGRAEVIVEVAARYPSGPGVADQVLEYVLQLSAIAVARPAAVRVTDEQPVGCVRASDARWASRQILDAEHRILSRAAVQPRPTCRRPTAGRTRGCTRQALAPQGRVQGARGPALGVHSRRSRRLSSRSRPPALMAVKPLLFGG